MSDQIKAEATKIEATAQADIADAKSWWEAIPWRYVAAGAAAGIIATLILRH